LAHVRFAKFTAMHPLEVENKIPPPAADFTITKKHIWKTFVVFIFGIYGGASELTII
jgi:hypothetical protein